MAAKASHRSIYDLTKKDLKNRTELKFDTGLKLGANYSDQSGLVSVDAERGAYRVGFDFQREDAVFQYSRKSSAGTFKFRQVVPGMHWEVVPSPVVELSTKLLDGPKLKDSLKLVYDFQNRFAFYTDTLKFNKRFKLRVAGDSKSSDTALCIGYKPDARWVKSVKLVQTAATGPLLSYKVKPADGWRVATEASLRSKVLAASVTYKALAGDAELVLDAAVPLPGSSSKVRLLRKAGVKSAPTVAHPAMLRQIAQGAGAAPAARRPLAPSSSRRCSASTRSRSSSSCWSSSSSSRSGRRAAGRPLAAAAAAEAESEAEAGPAPAAPAADEEDLMQFADRYKWYEAKFAADDMPDWTPGRFVRASQEAPFVRLVTLEVEVSRERVPLRNAYKAAGQRAALRVNGGEARSLPVASPPHPEALNQASLFLTKGDIFAGETKAAREPTSVLAEVSLLVNSKEAPEVYALGPDDIVSVGPFEGAGLDLRSSGVIGAFRFPTVVIFASGSGIATAAALLESPVGSSTHLAPALRSDVRLYYAAPNRASMCLAERFDAWAADLRVVTVPTTTGFMDAWDGDDTLVYDPEATAAIVLTGGDEEAEAAALEVCREAEIGTVREKQQQQQQQPARRRRRMAAALGTAVPAGFPVAVRSACVAIDGAPTDIIVSTYNDATVLMASQLGTLGTVIQAKQDSTLEGKTTFSTAVLLGKRDEPLLTIVARQLVELAHGKGINTPLLCCLALKQHTPEGVRQLLAAVRERELL
ncbi:psmg3 [Scenedesmus sp. PABB004]|nr:psmg3 [Scenedesmus sp. PABB004]